MIDLDRLDNLVVDLMIRRQGSRASAMQLMRALFKEEGLKPKQQKRVKALFHQWLSNEAMVEHAVEVGAPGEVMEALAGPLHLLASRVLSGDLSPKAARAKVEWIDWEHVARVPDEVRALKDPIQQLTLIGSITPWLAERMHAVMGDEAQACLEALQGKARVTVRANALRCTREELAERLAQEDIETSPTRYASFGLEITRPAQLLRTAAFREGWFEMQDEASQLVAEVVDPPRGGLVIDACAGAGGKALALAAMMGSEGQVVALDTDAPRLAELRRRARRAGARNIRAIRVRPDSWSTEVQELAGCADRILIDAPCTGLGSLRRNPDLRARITRDEVRRLTKIQGDLLQRAGATLAPGARLIYATCSLLPEENQDLVNHALRQAVDLEPMELAMALGAARAEIFGSVGGPFLQTLPHRHGMDGLFAALFERQTEDRAVQQ